MIQTNSKKLLIVEDDMDFSMILKSSMSRHYFQVTVTHSVEEAETVLQNESFAYATVDLKMPGLSGLHIIKKILDKNNDAKIVMLTGYAGINTAVEAIKLGAVHYLAKPATTEEILIAFESTTSNLKIKVTEKPNTIGMLEWEKIQQALQDNDFNISATARQLGMHRRTLQRKLQKKHYRK